MSLLQNAASQQNATIDDRFAEWDTSETISAVADALASKHRVTLVEANEDAYEKLKRFQPDIVFNIAEGYYGISREAQMPAILDMLNIPYTGSDPLTLATCLDKARTKEILSYHGIPNAKFIVAFSVDDVLTHSLTYPLMVKPIGEGSSKGIFSSSLVSSPEAMRAETERVLREYNQPALVEEFLPGREFTVAMLGNGSNLRALPIVEISYKDFPDDFIPLYSYEAKWILDSKDHQLDIYECPAHVDAKLADQITSLCLRTFQILRCRDWSRIDVRLDRSGVPNIIEINPLPGILPDPKDNSCYPKAARTAGMNYNEMLLAVLDAARKRYAA